MILSNLTFAAYGAALPSLIGYGWGSFAFYRDWHYYALLGCALALGAACRREGRFRV